MKYIVILVVGVIIMIVQEKQQQIQEVTQTSGKNEAWQANNIYDLAGNYEEWTQEARLTDGRVYRGR